MESKKLKRQRFDGCNNEEKNSLDEDESEIENTRYVPPSFVLLFLLPQKMSKRSTDLSKGIKSLNYLICIPKICYSRSDNFALEFLDRKSSKT